MKFPRWLGWQNEFTPRAVRLTIIAVLLTIGGTANGFTPMLPPTHTPRLVGEDSVRSDSIMKLVGVPVKVHTARAAMGVSSYRRSSQVQLAIEELRERDLVLPLPDLSPRQLSDSFDDIRGGGTRRHRAIDIHAPRGTPVLSVDDGRILKLHESRAGGISLYATDSRSRYIYFYGHLDAYHPNMREGMKLTRGDTIGFVGTTGNAPPNTPHLHFQILRASNVARWSRGTPINPVSVFK